MMLPTERNKNVFDEKITMGNMWNDSFRSIIVATAVTLRYVHFRNGEFSID